MTRPHETELRPTAGSSWGSWGGASWCPENSWAAGYQLLVERECGGGCDDTALNGVQLVCVTGHITSKLGSWGRWTNWGNCTGADNFLNSIQFKSEKVLIQ